jgi:hypothetical protein
MARSRHAQTITTREKASNHDALAPLLNAMYLEFKGLVSKKPDGVISKNKIAIVNRLLKDILTILEGEPNRPYLDLMNEDDLPQNSDVALVLSQYRAAMDQFKEKYFGYRGDLNEHNWFTK